MPPSGHQLATYSHFPPREIAFPPAQKLDETQFLQEFNLDAGSTIPFWPSSFQFNDMGSGPGFSPWWLNGHLSGTFSDLFNNITFDPGWEMVQPTTFFFPEGATEPFSLSPAWLSGVSSAYSNKQGFSTENSEVLLANT
ncbi:hypothetical protein CEP54_014974 [Fusarium duplospermum]|uniref:Uncharacterized protein n=1 Tax=Fusarium duplospermum TaxID=1325734 RepID=A0A428NSH7_9HYPO|nr:hypothetical protein CEP54_014974 [Fusarium duplospermum]